jgi:hypothetical protein
MTTYTSASADIERKKEEEDALPPSLFDYINGVAILKSDVVGYENCAFAVLS